MSQLDQVLLNNFTNIKSTKKPNDFIYTNNNVTSSANNSIQNSNNNNNNTSIIKKNIQTENL